MSNATNAGTSHLRPNLRTQINAPFHFHSKLSTNKKTAGKPKHRAVDDLCALDLFKSGLDIQGSIFFSKPNKALLGEVFQKCLRFALFDPPEIGHLLMTHDPRHVQ